jgi:hypothetical protein
LASSTIVDRSVGAETNQPVQIVPEFAAYSHVNELNDEANTSFADRHADFTPTLVELVHMSELNFTLEMRPTKVLVAKLDHNMLDIDMGFNATCCVAISLIGLLSLASLEIQKLPPPKFSLGYRHVSLAFAIEKKPHGWQSGPTDMLRLTQLIDSRGSLREPTLERKKSEGPPGHAWAMLF